MRGGGCDGHDSGQRVPLKAPAGLLRIQCELQLYSISRDGGGRPVRWKAHFVSAHRLHPRISAANWGDGDGEFVAGLRGANVSPRSANISLIVLSVTGILIDRIVRSLAVREGNDRKNQGIDRSLACIEHSRLHGCDRACLKEYRQLVD